ncbi:MAG: DUF4111 domain-containing protein [Ardenticatenales bacterium]|nr:DUF4111 domain-containing protein [Ardenticatenales bacterium]
MTPPTPYPDVNGLLEDLLRRVQSLLGNQVVGLYLFGSLTSGDFDEDSDVDVLVVTDGELSQHLVSSLAVMHERIAVSHSPWGTQLEVSYIPQRALRRHDPDNALHPHLDRGKGERLHWTQHGSDWVTQRYVLRERGITVVGPPPTALIDPVSSKELRQAMRVLLQEWIVPLLHNPTPIANWGYQSYLVLSLCRILYTLQEGTVVSKPTAACWAQQTLNPQWHSLIDRAWLGRHYPDEPAPPADLSETLAFMKYASQTIS